MSVVSTNLDENDDVNLRGQTKHSQSLNKMLCIGRELCFLMLIVFTAYASINSTSHSAGAPPPSPLFPRGSPVADFYRGQLSEALRRAGQADVSFVMYYAPWDAESRETVRQFEATARRHHHQVYFAAINCWQPGGECKRTLSKIQQFPKLVAYVTHETGVEYRGPRDARYMSLFLENIIRPLHRIQNIEDLTRLRSAYNAVVVAFLNFKGPRGGPPYRALYETAFKFLEKDARQEIAFAVVTSFKTALELGGNRTPHVRLYLWNETLDYPGHYSADPLSEWIQSRLHQVTLWLTPPGVKSLTLAPYVAHSPALVMFTPADNFVMYDLLREVGLEYYNCRSDGDVTQLAHNVSEHVSERVGRMRRASMSCHSRPLDLETTVQIAQSVWTNSSCDRRKRQCLLATERVPQCHSPTAPDVDPLSAPALMDQSRRDMCRRLAPPPPLPPPTPLAPPLQGLACRQNASVSLLAMDSHLFAHFARGLGVELGQAKGETTVVLMSPQMETTHMLSEPITRASLSQFLVNFTEGRLERFQRTAVPPPPPARPSPLPIVEIAELTTDTFMETAFNDSLTAVVLYYSPFCAFCHPASHVYLTVARRLTSVPSLVFTRIDGENNDLPWHLTAPRYPTVLIFPAGRKEESRVFRGGITADSLTQFVLANLPLELRLFAMVQLCQQTQTPASRRECLVQVRREVLEAISSSLLRYRALSLRSDSTDGKRSALRRVVGRLQRLKQLQLALSVDSARVPQLLQPTVTRDEL